MSATLVGRKVKVVGSIYGTIKKSNKFVTEVIGVNGTEYGIPTSQLELVHTYELTGYKLSKDKDTGELVSNGGLFVIEVEWVCRDKKKLAFIAATEYGCDGFEITKIVKKK